MLTYDEVIKLPKICLTHRFYYYSIHQDPSDQKIYNLDHKSRTIKLVRDPLNTKFTKDQIVLVKPVGEYGEILEVKKDPEWGNHSYDVKIFDADWQSCYYDECELEPIENTE